MKQAGIIVVGFVFGLFCEALALMIAAGGHGWNSPATVGLAGLLIFPFCFWSVASGRLLRKALGVCLASDAALLLMTIFEGIEYPIKVGPASLLWLSIWLAGQAPLLWAKDWQRSRDGDLP